ncbi:MAG: hypothetical protein QM613_01220 [Micrococcaceae bacterium]
MYLQINPGLCIVWTDKDTMQIGVNIPNPIQVDCRKPGIAELVDKLRYGANEKDIRDIQDKYQIDELIITALKNHLGNVLIESEKKPIPPEQLDNPNRLWGVVNNNDIPSLLRERSWLTLHITNLATAGANATIALANAGIKNFILYDPTQIRQQHLTSGIFQKEHRGMRHDIALAKILEEKFSDIECEILGNSHEPFQADFSLCFAKYTYPEYYATHIMRLNIPHLFILQQEHSATLGPLVIPYASACASCFKKKQITLQESWHDIVNQLQQKSSNLSRLHNINEMEEHSTALSTAGLAVIHTLLFLDKQSTPATINGILYIDFAEGTVTEKTLTQNSNCYCTQRPYIC